MARFGRFPWSRQVIARTIDALAAAHPKVIALDVLFTDPTTQEEDDNLARSIGHAGNVVVAAQLTDSPVHGGPSRWLPPLPAIERAAAADEQDALLVGARTMRFGTAPPAIAIIPSVSTRVLHGCRVTIDYIGPAGSF